MNIASLITTFAIVSASTVASAKPAFSFEARATASWNHNSAAQPRRPMVRDHREIDDDDCGTTQASSPGTPWRSSYEPAPMLSINNVKYVAWNAADYVGPLGTIGGQRHRLSALTEPTKVEHMREDFYIMGNGRFDTLQLRNTVGSTVVKQVTIEFMDESAQVVPLNTTLDRRNSTITIDVKGHNRAIKRIFVYGQTARNSAYQIFAS